MKKLLAILLVALTVATAVPATAALAGSDVEASLSDEANRLIIVGVTVNDIIVRIRPSTNSISVARVPSGTKVVVTRVQREAASGNVWCYFSTVPNACANTNASGTANARIVGWTLSENISLKINVVVEEIDDQDVDNQRVLGSSGVPSRGDVYDVEATITGMRYNAYDVLECYIYVPPQPGCEEGLEEGWYREDGTRSSNIIIALFNIICSWFK